mmetsp:Transcript_34191/g.74092  ORF Transcript_34191/g.74092 Transcript_34191/m.74092 type:complete len:244 (-) Transcript_34191:63-794(-)|eukprot:CAMPEP_0197499256 /NCGR_PEP_ID=MMETSP1311-20131121/60927_1 /TAXON_ID=464262 /ORGANISM="Genus nov. species nov., Strain RCC856" /LENGTH=243 /DNA_ID=CAMNT_0043044999 /DNA_START=191 /DNA_END=922 /DNA_ORIENTATION=+
MLTLDPNVRNWVMIPITFAMLLIGILRHLVSKLMRGNPTLKLKSVQAKQLVQRSQHLRAHASFLTRAGFAQRKRYFVDKQEGKFCQKVDPSLNPQSQMMSDPSMLSDMLTKNLTMIVPQIVTGAWVNFFFSGFVVAKVPFPLTQKFKLMLQRGVDLSDLDVTYISSLSWYFLNLFGMQGVLSLILGEKTFDDTQMMQQQMSMGTGMGMDAPNMFKGEKDALEMTVHTWKVDSFIEKAAQAVAI